MFDQTVKLLAQCVVEVHTPTKIDDGVFQAFASIVGKGDVDIARVLSVVYCACVCGIKG